MWWKHHRDNSLLPWYKAPSMIHEARRSGTLLYIMYGVFSVCSCRQQWRSLLIRNNCAQPETTRIRPLQQKRKTNKNTIIFHINLQPGRYGSCREGALRLWVNNLKRHSNEAAEPRYGSDHDDRKPFAFMSLASASNADWWRAVTEGAVAVGCVQRV